MTSYAELSEKERLAYTKKSLAATNKKWAEYEKQRKRRPERFHESTLPYITMNK